MRKLLISAVAMLQVLAASSMALAEQPLAESYRMILTGGKYYVDYSRDKQKYHDFVAQENSVRMAGFKSEKLLGTDLYPAARYEGDNYYQFFNNAVDKRCSEIEAKILDRRTQKSFMGITIDTSYMSAKTVVEKGLGNYGKLPNVGFMLAKNELNNIHLDPKEYWGKVREKLALPDELKIFLYNDGFMTYLSGERAPLFAETTKCLDGGKEYTADKYVSKIVNATGNTCGELWYVALYNAKGELFKIKRQYNINGKVATISEIKLHQLTDVIPAKAINMPAVKIYAADKGKITDLLKKPTLVSK